MFVWNYKNQFLKISMKEKLDQLENLLIEMDKLVETETDRQKLMQEISIEEWDNLFSDEMGIPLLSPELIKSRRDYFLKKKSDKSLEEVSIPRFKAILEKAQLRVIDLIHESDENNDRKIIRKFIEHKIITTDTQISFGNRKDGNIVGYLTPLGDFQVKLNGKSQSFLSFNEAAQAVNERAKDGWSDWVANDKSGQLQNLKFFKKELRSLMSKLEEFL